MQSNFTYDYPHCEFPFEEWNPVQAKCLPFFTEDMNLVVSATVASGKTAIAEAIMAYEISSNKGKAIYASPLKALSLEKAENWAKHPTFSKFKIALLDGDHNTSREDLESADLVIATVEALDVCAKHRANWLEKAKALVFDETHLLGQGDRGACAEAMLMEFTAFNPSARVICLSGTMGNAREIASWLKLLNGKRTSFLASEWRPSKLTKKAVALDGLDKQFKHIEKSIIEGPYDKVLVFVHSKKIGKLLCERLRHCGIRCGFFHSALNPATKEKLALAFKDAANDLNVLIATSSLAMGVNL